MTATSKPAGRPDRADEVHVITSRVEKWRFKCPMKHHTDWRLWNGVFSCRSCQQLRASGERDVEPVFDQLWDDKEERLVPREQIVVRA